MRVLASLILLTLVGCASHRDHTRSFSSCAPQEDIADSFMLKDQRTGESFGPFGMTNGTPVLVGSRTLALQLGQSKLTKLKEHMKQTVIPQIEFRHAALIDICDFLSRSSVCFCCDSNDDPFVTFVILGKGIASKRVSLSMRNASVFDAFTVVCDMHALTYRLDGRGVVFIMPRSGSHVTFEDDQLSPFDTERAEDDPF